MKITIDTQKINELTLKREVVKIALVIDLLEKLKGKYEYHWIKLYTDFEVEKGLTIDLFFENIKSKETRMYKIISDKNRIKNLKGKLNKVWSLFEKKVYIINLDKMSNNINKLREQIGDLE